LKCFGYITATIGMAHFNDIVFFNLPNCLSGNGQTNGYFGAIGFVRDKLAKFFYTKMGAFMAAIVAHLLS
jgi:hypothetical protein